MPRTSSSRSIFHKVLAAHLEDGEVVPGRFVSIRIDQTLTGTGASAACYLEFEAIGLDRVATEISVSYVNEASDPMDHPYLESVAARHGIHFSRPANGPAHQVHVERFAVPGKSLLGTDPRSVACGGLGMLALVGGELSVAVAMGRGPFRMRCPEVVQVFLRGKLKSRVTARDVALELIRRRSPKGGVGKVLEFGGPGVRGLTIDDRVTIAILGAEIGALTTMFPSDDRTRSFLQMQRRAKAFRRIEADADATFDDREEIDLGSIEPLVAAPPPLGVRPVREVAGTPIRESVVGAGGQASLRDVVAVGAVLKGRKVHPSVAFTLSPGSRQIRQFLESDGSLDDLVSRGVRVGDASGPVPSGGVFVRTEELGVCLVSAETAAASGAQGELTDPRTLKRVPRITLPRRLAIDDSLLVRPQKDGTKIEVRRGPHLVPLPPLVAMATDLTARVLLKTGDEVSDKHVLPPGELRKRPDLAALADLAFSGVDPEFTRKAREWGGGSIVAGRQYGAGDTGELTALTLRMLGLRFVLARSFSRAHVIDLVHFGIVPLTFISGKDYDSISVGDDLHVPEASTRLRAGRPVIVENRSNGRQIEVRYELTDREREVLVDGGLLAFTRRRARKGKEAVAA